jgi:hypothetical protein
MVDIKHEAIILCRTARENDQDADQWRVGGFARNELLASFSRNSGTVEVRGLDEVTFMGLPVVVDRDLPDRRVTLRAGENTVGAFTV